MDEDDQVKIAICILNKDCAQQLKKCLDSLTSQVFKDFVVVVAAPAALLLSSIWP